MKGEEMSNGVSKKGRIKIGRAPTFLPSVGRGLPLALEGLEKGVGVGLKGWSLGALGLSGSRGLMLAMREAVGSGALESPRESTLRAPPLTGEKMGREGGKEREEGEGREGWREGE